MNSEIFNHSSPLRGAVKFRRSRDSVPNEAFDSSALQRDRNLLEVLSGQLANRQNFKILFGALEKQIPAAISHVFPVMQNYLKLKESFPEQLSDKDVEYLNQAMGYMENWFYRLNWLDTSEVKTHKRHPSDYNDLYLPAAIFNILAKIAYVSKSQDLRKPDTAHICDLLENACRHAVNTLMQEADVLNISRLEIDYLHRQNLQNHKTSPDRQNFSLENLVKNINFLRSKVNISRGKKQHSENTLEDILNREKRRMQTLVARTDLSNPLYFFKSCLLAQRMQFLQDQAYGKHLFLPPLNNLEQASEYAQAFDFQTGKISNRKVEHPFSTMHFMSKEINATLSVVDYLRKVKLRGKK